MQLDALCALKTDSDILNRLGKLPHKLAALYLETYNDRLAPNSGAAAKLIQNTFHWLLCTQQSLNSDAFLVVISQLVSRVPEAVTRDQLLDLCCNFVIYDDKLDVFRFAHRSVQEFLETLPQFVATTSHSLIAEHCLAYIMSQAESPTIQRFLADHYSLPDSYSLRDHEDTMRRFWWYAFYQGMKHCKQAGVKRTQGSLQKLLHMLFLDERGASSLLNVQLKRYAWALNILGEMHHKLRKGAVLSAKNNLQGAFLIACLFGFPEIISQYLQSPLPTDLMAEGLLLATDNEHEDVIAELRIKSRTVFTADVLRYALRELETQASEYQQLLPLFLDGGERVPITKNVVRWACGSFGRMALLILCHPRSLDETENLLVAAASTYDCCTLELLLRHTETPRVNENMIESAATSRNLHTLLRQPFVTSSVMKAALRNENFDKECMELLESRVGRIHASLDVLKGILACRDSWVWEEILLRRGAQVTEDSIVLVAQRKWMVDESVRWHLMGNTTVQLSQELVERVMGLDSAVRVVKVLLHHLTPAFKFTESLVLRAMDLDPGKDGLVPSLLARDPAFKLTEHVMLEAIRGKEGLVPLLLARDPAFKLTEHVMLEAMYFDSEGKDGLVPLLLARDPAFKLTEDVMLEAMHLGNDGLGKDGLGSLLMTRDPAFKLTESVMLRAMYLDSWGKEDLVPLLLAHDPAFRITESLIERTISDPRISRPFLELLLSHDRSFRVSDQLVKQSILQISKGLGSLIPNTIRSKGPFRTIPRVPEEDLRPLKLLLDHDPQFRITSDLLEQLEWRHEPSEEVMDVLWACLVRDGNAEEVISEGLERYRHGRDEHGSITWALLLLRQDRAQGRNVRPVPGGE